MSDSYSPWSVRHEYHEPMMRKRASYSVRAVTSTTVFIVDDCKSHFMSVTNAAESVVEECLSEFGEKRIVYRDTDGRWDELLHTGIAFRGFAPYEGEIPGEGRAA